MEQVLLWYDGPQILLGSISRNRKIIAVAIADNNHEGQFLGAAVSDEQLLSYDEGKYDLRYLITQCFYGEWYSFLYEPDQDKICFYKINRDSALIIDSIPEAGLFSRSHDPITKLPVAIDYSTEKFSIDGHWQFAELSKFYNQVSDIYHIYNTIRRITEVMPNGNEERQIQSNFLRPFQGGGSYVGMFNSIANDNFDYAPLRFSGVKYNSPGWIEVKGRREQFGQTVALIDHFANFSQSIKTSYTELYSYLSKTNLLSADADVFIMDSVLSEIKQLTLQLCVNLPDIRFGDILKLSSDNYLVTAKVCLSICRRGERLASFFLQGRANYGDIDISTAAMLQD
ncbi:hypothetical protein [Polymorphobacter multimanifer]|uniref:Uncharacterized protein YktA (UPF0223 family) n=1 Tax=Polymorphobacter multimanifer TaxID=1070431 RepID=A0A841L8W1_9SPHN|nr:hypothetical protein [Polymorphobacter multimanifer]MBB6227403.1 uncharacterized protein YktA (UPF0223 family) [Polymorphobacter multimanifer]